LKISVLTPSFNSALYIERAITSVLDQDYSQYEHIIMDGGSVDGTVQILQKYPSLIWVSEQDAGQSDAMNKAFEKATGDIIVYLNTDDFFLPGAFKKVIEAFNASQEADMIVGDLYIQRGGSQYSRCPSMKFNEILKFWDYKFPLNPVSYFYRTSVQQQIGLFPSNKHFTMDYWFLLRAYRKFNVKKIEVHLGVFVMHEDNKSSNNAVLQNLKKEVFQYFNETRDWFHFPRFIKSYFFYILKQKVK